MWSKSLAHGRISRDAVLVALLGCAVGLKGSRQRYRLSSRAGGSAAGRARLRPVDFNRQFAVIAPATTLRHRIEWRSYVTPKNALRKTAHRDLLSAENALSEIKISKYEPWSLPRGLLSSRV
jgi:hypothetical protein